MTGAIGCGGLLTDGGLRTSRIVLRLGSGFGAQQAGNFASVLDLAELTIASAGGSATFTGNFGAGETETTIDIGVQEGNARFDLAVLSNNKTIIYRADTTITIGGGGLRLTLRPDPVNAVLAVAPRNPNFGPVTDNGQTRSFPHDFVVRNPGLSTLSWRVDSLRPPGVLQVLCVIPAEDNANCLTTRPAASTASVAIIVTFVTPTGTGMLPTQGVHFISNVGEVTVAKVP